MIARLSCDHCSSPRHFSGLLSPQWVNRIGLTPCPQLPIYPSQRTPRKRPDWSARCAQDRHFVRLIKTEVACFDLYEARHSKIRWPCSSTTNTRFDLQKSPALLNSAARHLAWFIASSEFEKLFPSSSAKS